MNALGRVLDKGALDGDNGPRARTKIDVPAVWAKETSLIEIRLPKNVMCARCDGGGCESCGLSGALRCPENEVDRTLRVRLPKTLGDGVAMRIAEPFGKGQGIAQMWIEVRPAKEPSRFVRKLVSTKRERIRVLPRMVLGLSVFMVLLILVLVLLTLAKR